jgi:hypothetical protein
MLQQSEARSDDDILADSGPHRCGIDGWAAEGGGEDQAQEWAVDLYREGRVGEQLPGTAPLRQAQELDLGNCAQGFARDDPACELDRFPAHGQLEVSAARRCLFAVLPVQLDLRLGAGLWR